MEFYLSASTIVAAILSIVVLAFLLHTHSQKTAKPSKTRNPPQVKGAWPVIGHLRLLRGPELPHKVLGEMDEEYGPIFTIRLGAHQALVVSDAEIAKDCFIRNDKSFSSRPKAEWVKLMAYNYAFFGFAPYGEYWRQMRKMVMIEVLCQRRVEMIGDIRASEIRASIMNLYDVWLNNKKSENLEMVRVVEMGQWFRNLVVNIMVRTISGKRFSPNDEEDVRFQTVLNKFNDLVGLNVISDFIPYLKYFDVGRYKKAMKETARDLDNIFDGWLKEHKIDSNSLLQHKGHQDFIYVLISILQRASEQEFPGFDHDTIIKATCENLLAGVDAISITLTWSLALLMNNPKVLQTAQDEIDEHVGRERLVEESDLKNLDYLDTIIKETFRLYPPGPFVIRESLEDCIVCGYNIPKGTHLFVNLWKIQRDPNIWSEPHKFRPERFLTRHKGIDVKGNHYELLPFGSGRRICPGVSFTLQALSLTLASLIQQFVIKNPSNEVVDMTESRGLTNKKATSLDVLLAPRLSSNLYHVGY